MFFIVRSAQLNILSTKKYTQQDLKKSNIKTIKKINEKLGAAFPDKLLNYSNGWKNKLLDWVVTTISAA